MIAQVLPATPRIAAVEDDDAALDRELLLDDLSTIAQSIHDLLRDHDRGININASLSDVVERIKAIAICQGITKEIFEKHDKSLAAVGLKASLESIPA